MGRRPNGLVAGARRSEAGVAGWGAGTDPYRIRGGVSPSSPYTSTGWYEVVPAGAPVPVHSGDSVAGLSAILTGTVSVSASVRRQTS
ncbi:hypothetical protein [Streptomyces sp. B21-083]|uniref:hypothetical protein n=1 Tax=Streptomyces sp. B21-083 TaxID=3039410 RepID=UPI002FF10989